MKPERPRSKEAPLGFTACAHHHAQTSTRPGQRYRWLPLAVILMLSGCATIKEGAKQTIAIDTPDTPGTDCAVNTANGKPVAMVTTPGEARLRSRTSALTVVCRRDGFQETTQIVKSTFNKRSRLQGPEGMLVDAVSGAMWRFPSAISVLMQPLVFDIEPPCVISTGETAMKQTIGFKSSIAAGVLAACVATAAAAADPTPGLMSLDTDKNNAVSHAEFVSALKQRFDKMDKNTNGKVTQSELLSFGMKQMRGSSKDPIFSRAQGRPDVPFDKNGEVDFKAFSEALTRFRFDPVDSNRDRVLSAAEINARISR